MKVIETLRSLQEAATGGRWETYYFQVRVRDGRFDDGDPAYTPIANSSKRDASHIAAAHNAHDALLKVAEAAPAFARMAEALGNAPDDWRIISWEAGRIVVTAGDVRRIAAALAELEALEL